MKSMNIFKKVLFVLFSFNLSIFLFTGCGYKPTTYYAKQELSGKVFVDLYVDLEDPKNAVLIKDAMNQLLVQKIGSKLVYDRSLADSLMYVKINSVSFRTLQYDKDGYNKLYKATVSILVKYTNSAKKQKTFTVSGENNFSVDSAIKLTEINDTLRFDAIKKASDDALDEVLSKIAISSFDNQ